MILCMESLRIGAEIALVYYSPTRDRSRCEKRHCLLPEGRQVFKHWRFCLLMFGSKSLYQSVSCREALLAVTLPLFHKAWKGVSHFEKSKLAGDYGYCNCNAGCLLEHSNFIQYLICSSLLGLTSKEVRIWKKQLQEKHRDIVQMKTTAPKNKWGKRFLWTSYFMTQSQIFCITSICKEPQATSGSLTVMFLPYVYLPYLL